MTKTRVEEWGGGGGKGLISSNKMMMTESDWRIQRFLGLLKNLVFD